jgi:hypothetical protein
MSSLCKEFTKNIVKNETYDMIFPLDFFVKAGNTSLKKKCVGIRQ